MMASAAGNPFSTRHVGPRAIEYRFAPGDDAAGVVARLAAAGWRGAIIGPHGSGKTTLLAALEPALIAAGRRPARITLHDGQRRLGRDLSSLHLAADTVLVIDGYEQLGWAARRGVGWLCWRRGCGLLVTAHGPVGLPVVRLSAVDEALARDLAAQLQRGWPTLVDADDATAALRAQRGNLREALFALYDLYERRRRASIAATPTRDS
jgi:energy-coupling factor transporter ATP-binding protein EcfA2